MIQSLDSLAAQVARVDSADASEQRSQERILALIESAGDPFARTRYVPGHLTASAVVLDDARERALLIFHEKLQLWLQPGGHFEPSERDPLAAATCEALEETRLRCLPALDEPLFDLDVHAIPARAASGARAAEPPHDHFDLRFLLVAEAPASAQIGEGVSALRWVDRARWRALDLDPGLRRALKKAFA